jgi:glycosyltransferase involved in cell wall biosynthesis
MQAPVINVGFIGRFNPVKGVDILLDLIHHLSSDQFAFRIAGEGPEQEKIEALDLPHVEYLGMLSYHHIRPFIEGCHVIIIPSYADNLVTVGIEALMHQRCLVLSRHTGLAEYIAADEEAILCDPTFEAFRDALQRLHADRGMLQRISAQGRLCFQHKFELEAHVRNVEQMMLG